MSTDQERALRLMTSKYGPPDRLESTCIAIWETAKIKLVIRDSSYEVVTPDSHFEVSDLESLRAKVA